MWGTVSRRVEDELSSFSLRPGSTVVPPTGSGVIPSLPSGASPSYRNGAPPPTKQSISFMTRPVSRGGALRLPQSQMRLKSFTSPPLASFIGKCGSGSRSSQGFDQCPSCFFRGPLFRSVHLSVTCLSVCPFALRAPTPPFGHHAPNPPPRRRRPLGRSHSDQRPRVVKDRRPPFSRRPPIVPSPRGRGGGSGPVPPGGARSYKADRRPLLHVCRLGRSPPRASVCESPDPIRSHSNELTRQSTSDHPSFLPSAIAAAALIFRPDLIRWPPSPPRWTP